MSWTRNYQYYRGLTRIILLVLALGIPFVHIGGESAFRFDLPSLTLHVFGISLAMDEFFLVLVALLFLIFFIMLATIIFGRIWCGWLCPQTVVADLTGFVDRGSRNSIPRKTLAVVAVILISSLLSAAILWYFIDPYAFFTDLRRGTMGPVASWSWAVLTVVTALNFLFLRRRFCASVCPYARMQGTLYDDQTLIIAMDPARRDECMHCDACVRICPVDIDVRKGVQMACINCAACIDTCADRMARRSRPSLINYRFGRGTRTAWMRRRGVLFSAAGAVVLLIFLLLLAGSRAPLEMVVIHDDRARPFLAGDGGLVNTYILSVTNRSGSDLLLHVAASGDSGDAQVEPSSIAIDKQGHRRFVVTIRTKFAPLAGSKPEKVAIILTSKASSKVLARQQVLQAAP